MTEGKVLTYATRVAVDARTFGWIILAEKTLVHMVIVYGSTIKMEIASAEPGVDPDDLILDTIALFGDQERVDVDSRTFQVPESIITGMRSKMSVRRQNSVNQIAAYYGRQQYEQHRGRTEKALIE